MHFFDQPPIDNRPRSLFGFTFIMTRTATLLSFAIVSLTTVQSLAAETQVISIKTLPAQMRYDITDFSVLPGSEVRIIFEKPEIPRQVHPDEWMELAEIFSSDFQEKPRKLYF